MGLVFKLLEELRLYLSVYIPDAAAAELQALQALRAQGGPRRRA